MFISFLSSRSSHVYIFLLSSRLRSRSSHVYIFLLSSRLRSLQAITSTRSFTVKIKVPQQVFLIPQTQRLVNPGVGQLWR